MAEAPFSACNRTVESDSLARPRHAEHERSRTSPASGLDWTATGSSRRTLGISEEFRNVVRDPRVAGSIEGTEVEPPGLKQYLVVHGRARLVEGGAPELLQRLAHVYLGPEVKFPWTTRLRVT